MSALTPSGFAAFDPPDTAPDALQLFDVAPATVTVTPQQWTDLLAVAAYAVQTLSDGLDSGAYADPKHAAERSTARDVLRTAEGVLSALAPLRSRRSTITIH